VCPCPPVRRDLAQKDHLPSPLLRLFRDRPSGNCRSSPIDRIIARAFTPLGVLGAEHTRVGLGHPLGLPRTLKASPLLDAWPEDNKARENTADSAGNRPDLGWLVRANEVTRLVKRPRLDTETHARQPARAVRRGRLIGSGRRSMCTARGQRKRAWRFR